MLPPFVEQVCFQGTPNRPIIIQTTSTTINVGSQVENKVSTANNVKFRAQFFGLSLFPVEFIFDMLFDGFDAFE
jgi:hypothetical protein